MYSNAIFPTKLSNEELDEYLNKGWFRMGQCLFTTNFLIFNGQLYSVAWLRVGLTRFNEDKKLAKLKKINKEFEVKINKANISAAHSLLFETYKNNVSFEASESLVHLLGYQKKYNIFDTYQVEIFDKGKLIACGIFDMGLNAAQGITSFYDPDYKKNSLGKYLICLKMEFCQQRGIQYFYPGYFVPGYQAFDYKLELGSESQEFLNLASNTWEEIRHFNLRETPIQTLWRSLSRAQETLKKANVETDFLYYPYFSFNLMADFIESNLIETPMFLKIKKDGTEMNKIIFYHVDTKYFDLVSYLTVLTFEIPNANESNFNKEVIRIEKVECSSLNILEIANYVTKNVFLNLA